MKRNWKIIRAILREEDTSAWPEQVVLEHKVLCAEAGYICAHVLRGYGSGYTQVVQYEQPWQTEDGLEVAELMACESDLDECLKELDEKNIGHASEFVMALLRQKAINKIHPRDKP